VWTGGEGRGTEVGHKLKGRSKGTHGGISWRGKHNKPRLRKEKENLPFIKEGYGSIQRMRAMSGNERKEEGGAKARKDMDKCNGYLGAKKQVTR